MSSHSTPAPAGRAAGALVAACLTGAWLGALAPGAAADRVITVDGRVLKPLKAREQGQGYVLTFEHGEIVLPDASLVKTVEIEGDMSDYVPQSDDERDKLEKGYVRYGGKWMSKPAYEDQLAKENAAAKERADELAAHSNFHNAWEIETKHFVLRSDTSPELLQGYADMLEAYYALMDKRFGIKLSPEMRRTKMTVNIYKNRREFMDLNAANVPPGVAGYFWSYDKTLNFFHNYAEPSMSQWVALHEGTHLLTYLIDPQYVAQIWLNEAVADYFGSADVTVDAKGRYEIVSGKLQTDRVLTVQQAIKEGEDIALKTLFHIPRESFHAFEYAHAWSFIYFLNKSDSGYQKAFDRFFKDIYTLKKGIETETVNTGDKTGTGKRVPAAEIERVVLKALKKDVEELDAEWKSFIAEIPIEGAEARFKRGYRAVIQGGMFSNDAEVYAANKKQALEDLEAAIAGGIADPRAWWARSKARLLSGDRKGSREDLEKCIELDPLNATYRFELGLMQVGGPIVFTSGSLDVELDMSGAAIESPPEALAAIGLATELSPENDYYRKVLDDIRN